MRLLLPVAALLVLAGGCAGGGEEQADLPLGRQIAAKATFTPPVHLFAEPVVASVEVVVDRDHLDPAHVRLQTRFLPYEVKGVGRDREDRGRFTLLRYEYTLRCLRIACIPEILPSAAGAAETGRGERRTFDLTPARVLYDDPAGETRVLRTAGWPTLESASRIIPKDVPSFGFVFRTSVAPLPEPDYRVPPALLGAGLLAGALALIALPVGLGVGWLRRRRPTPPPEEPELPPLERALRLVEWARERENGEERREALEVLAVELESARKPELAVSARELAWSPAAPSPESAESLVTSVRESDGKRA
ncbi:hypothetical protein BH09ACT13_BH09ACT13_03500 [soil metagenome]